MSDWDASDDETTKKTTTPAVVAAKPPVKKANKWDGEDEDDDGPVSDWENSESEQEKTPAPVSNAAPPKKKGTLKAKLAEKEAARAAKSGDDDELYDEDSVLDPRAKALRDKQREVESDLKNAADLFGTDSSGEQVDIKSVLNANPKTKEDFVVLSRQIFELVIKRHQDKPLYAAFVEAHAKELANPLRDVDVRKVASGLTTLANEKQKETRDKTSGKKKKAAKPVLGSTKAIGKADTNLYEEALDDFGNDPNDFM